MQGEVLEGLAMGLALGDVADRGERVVALAVFDRPPLQLHREGGAVAPRTDRLDRSRRARPRRRPAPPRAVVERAQVVAALGGDHEPERVPDLLAVAVAEERADRSVDRLDPTDLVEDEDPVGDVVEHRLGQLVAFAQGRVQRLQLPRLHEERDEGRDLGPQHARQDRREDEVDRAARVGAGRLRLTAAEGGDEDDRDARRRRMLADQLRRLEAVQLGHPDVHQDQREGLVKRRLERGPPGLDLDDRVAERRQHRPQRDPLVGVVVDDQDRRRRADGRALDHGARGHRRSRPRQSGAAGSHSPSTASSCAVSTGLET